MSVTDRETHRGFAEQVVRRRDCQVFRRLLPGQMPLPGTATGPAWAGGSSGALRPFAEILSFCDKKKYFPLKRSLLILEGNQMN